MARILGVLSVLIYALSVVSVLVFPPSEQIVQRVSANGVEQRVSTRVGESSGSADQGSIVSADEARPTNRGATSTNTTANDASSRQASSARIELPQMVGMSLNLYHTEDLSLYLDAVDRIAAMGFNTVHVVTPMFQRNGASQQIERLVGPGRALPESDLLRLLRHAKAKGLHTTLMPQVNFTHPRGNEWRGKIQPQRWGAWWGEYQALIGQHAALAEQADVDLFIIGCELLSTQKSDHVDRWQRVIDHVRQRFDGALSYSTNWDSYQKFKLWDELDAIGISGYWDVTRAASDPKSPTDRELAARWQTIRETVLAFAEARDRPVLITELGYPSLPWALRDPWNYVNPDELKADHDTQARGYRAFLNAWQDTLVVPLTNSPQMTTVRTPQAQWHLPRQDMAGVLFYRWDPYYQGGPDDTGYGVVGKPAFKVLERWLNTKNPADGD